MSPIDIAAAAIFALCWVFYEPLLERVSSGHGGINRDMIVLREAWIRQMLGRENRIMDTNLLGHLLSSASFFASTNLLIIAAAAGLLFGGETMLDSLRGLDLFASAPNWLMEAKIGLVMITLTRGLLDFIWSIRQLNYCVALFGAAPDHTLKAESERFVAAASDVLNPALQEFNKGVRAYYFALAAAAWLVSPYAMAAAAVWAFFLLARRQTASQAAGGIRAAKEFIAGDKLG